MKKSKHFRKDVIIARIIAALILIVLIALIVTVVSHFTRPSADKDSQNTQNTQDTNIGNKDSEEEDSEDQNSENEDDISNTQQDSENDSDADATEKIYVKTTTQVRLREEPNTSCSTLDRISGGTELEVLETLEGWYKVSYNGKTGYVSADYAKIVEE